jgi:hypothetical protein
MITLPWIGGEHDFALDIGNLRALQQSCDAGPEQILRRLTAGTWRIDDLFGTIRLGLIGGGMAAKDATALVNDLFAKHPYMGFRLTAQAILMAALVGPDDDQVGEPKGDAPPPENGNSAKSTATAQ